MPFKKKEKKSVKKQPQQVKTALIQVHGPDKHRCLEYYSLGIRLPGSFTELDRVICHILETLRKHGWEARSL